MWRDTDDDNDVDYNGDHAGEEVHIDNEDNADKDNDKDDVDGEAIDNEDTEGDETGTGQHLPPVGAH